MDKKDYYVSGKDQYGHEIRHPKVDWKKVMREIKKLAKQKYLTQTGEKESKNGK